MLKIKKYESVFYAVAGFFLASAIYHVLGSSKNVYWLLYIKTVKDLFLIYWVYLALKIKKDINSIVCIIASIFYVFSVSSLRWWCALRSSFDYVDYMEKLKSQDASFLLFDIIAFLVLTIILARNEPRDNATDSEQRKVDSSN